MGEHISERGNFVNETSDQSLLNQGYSSLEDVLNRRKIEFLFYNPKVKPLTNEELLDCVHASVDFLVTAHNAEHIRRAAPHYRNPKYIFGNAQRNISDLVKHGTLIDSIVDSIDVEKQVKIAEIHRSMLLMEILLENNSFQKIIKKAAPQVSILHGNLDEKNIFWIPEIKQRMQDRNTNTGIVLIDPAATSNEYSIEHPFKEVAQLAVSLLEELPSMGELTDADDRRKYAKMQEEMIFPTEEDETVLLLEKPTPPYLEGLDVFFPENEFINRYLQITGQNDTEHTALMDFYIWQSIMEKIIMKGYRTDDLLILLETYNNKLLQFCNISPEATNEYLVDFVKTAAKDIFPVNSSPKIWNTI